MAPLEYINKLRSLNKMNSSIASPTGGAASGAGTSDLLGKFSSISNRLAGFTDSTSLGGIFSGVRNLLPSRKQLPITRIVELAMNGKPGAGGGGGSGLGIGLRSAAAAGMGSVGSVVSGSVGGQGGAAKIVEDFIHFDPKQARRGNLAGSNAIAGDTAGVGASQEAIVFVIGGGNYIEYQNLMEFAQHSTPRKHILGHNVVDGSKTISGGEGGLDLSASGDQDVEVDLGGNDLVKLLGGRGDLGDSGSGAGGK
ncbi:Vesicle trafficking between the ER and Golgi, partial [Kickxella alabastrina]